MIGWLRADPAFDTEWTTHYRQLSEESPFVVFERIE